MQHHMSNYRFFEGRHKKWLQLKSVDFSYYGNYLINSTLQLGQINYIFCAVINVISFRYFIQHIWKYSHICLHIIFWNSLKDPTILSWIRPCWISFFPLPILYRHFGGFKNHPPFERGDGGKFDSTTIHPLLYKISTMRKTS